MIDEKETLNYLTLVFKNPPVELVEEMTNRADCVYMSWSHVPAEQEALAKAKQ